MEYSFVMNYLDQIFQQKNKLLEMGKNPTKVKIPRSVVDALKNEYVNNTVGKRFDPESKISTICDLQVEVHHSLNEITVE
jgi:hypothetical protein